MKSLISGTVQAIQSSDGLEKAIALSLLRHLRGARLTIIEGEQVYQVGEDNSPLEAEINVLHPSAYRRFLLGGSIGAAEAYVEGLWQSPALVNVIRIFARNLPVLDKLAKRIGWMSQIFLRISHRKNRNTITGSRTNIAAHYDLSNKMYELFLDKHMQYSSGIYPFPGANLEQAQEHKLKVICERLQLSHEDHLLEIGTGWGGLACYAAQHYGCQVTTTTISEQQYQFAKQRIDQLGLQDKVTLLFKDYRKLQGSYSKIVSVEMIEAVGHEYLPQYFRTLDHLLGKGGRILIQAITIQDQRYDVYRKSVDFIQRYIFPGGCLPSVSEMCRHLKEQTDMTLTHFADYAVHYADTLKEWNDRFKASTQELLELGFNEDFIRLWQYYFCYCEGGFRESTIGLAHFEAVKAQ